VAAADGGRSAAAVAGFLDALARSGLVPDGRAAADPTDATADALAARMVEDGLLTRFQADKLLQGQWQGLVLGPYRILSPLGRGGMGVVYLARETTPAPDGVVRPLLAIKILPPAKAVREPRTRARFLREMELGRLVPPHPHLARVFDTGEVSGVLYIAMEYVPGRTVRAIVQEHGPMPVGDAARVFAQVADGLAAAHAAGLIHRDIKPANVLVRPDGSAKLLDFGFAIQAGDRFEGDPQVVGGAGYVLGTMDYIAPEQAADTAAATPAADQYALGCSLYYALAGCPPFPGGTPVQKIRWHQHDAPPPLRSLRPDLPGELVAVVDRLMAKDPAARFPSAFHAAAVLKAWAAEPSAAAPAVVEVPDDAPEPATASRELWATDVIEGPADEPQDEPVRLEELLPVWGWAAVTAAVLLLAMAAGFLTRLAVG
jgi:serine/threonine protein kinase